MSEPARDKPVEPALAERLSVQPSTAQAATTEPPNETPTIEESAMSTTKHFPAHAQDEDSYLDEEQWEPELLPRRPRRRLLTPATALLFALLVGAGGFIVGVQVEKSEVPASSGRAGGGRLAALLAGGTAGAGGAAGAGGTAGASGAGVGGATGAGGATGGGGRTGAGSFGGLGRATIGQVANVSGSDLFVTNAEGNTIKVSGAAAQITKQVSTSAKGVHPGDTVIVQGATRSDGSIQATTIRDSGSASAGGGLSGLIGAVAGGSSGGRGASAASGGSSGAGGSGNGGSGGSGEPALFGK
jgi:hypothetical protein